MTDGDKSGLQRLIILVFPDRWTTGYSLFQSLYDNYPEGYDCSVKVLSIKEILTKPIEELTAENEEEFGNDPVDIFEDNMWISGGYLNIILIRTCLLK